MDIYEDNKCAESGSSNEIYETLQARRNESTSQVTFDNHIELKSNHVVKEYWINSNVINLNDIISPEYAMNDNKVSINDIIIKDTVNP